MMYWIAFYGNGDCDDGRSVSYSQIKRDKLVRFAVCLEDRFLFEMYLQPGEILQWRRRVWKTAGLPDRELSIVVCGDSINFVFPDGRVEHRSAWEDNHPYADQLVQMECEV